MLYLTIGFTGFFAVFMFSACKLSHECHEVENSPSYYEEKTF